MDRVPGRKVIRIAALVCGLAAVTVPAPPAPASAATTSPTRAAPAGPGLAAQSRPDIAWIGAGVSGVQGVAVSPDRTTLATATQDNTVKLWRIADGTLIRTITGHNSHVQSVAFSPDGQFLVSGAGIVFGDPSSFVKLWRASDGAFVGDLPVPSPSNDANTVAFSPDGTLVAAGHQGGLVNIWRTADRRLLRTFTADTSSIPSVFSLAFAPNGQQLATGGADGAVRVWRVSNWTLQRRLTGHTNFVASLAYSPDGTTLASGSWDQTVRLWNASTFRLRRTLRATDPVYAVAFSADSRTVASGSGDTVGLWNAGTGAPLRNLTHQAVSSLAFAGSDTVLSGGFDSHVRHWTTDGVLRATWGKHTGVLRSVTFSPDGSLFASSAADTTARLWRASDGADVQVLAEHIDVVNAVAFSPDGQLLATASGSGDRDPARNTIKIWRVGTAASLLTLRGHDFGSTDVAFSVDGSTLISVGLDRALRFWRVSDGALIRVVTVEQPRAPLAMSGDRKLVAVGGRTGINIYYADDGTLLRTIPVTLGGVADLVFSPDNGFIAAGLGAYGNNVQIFDVNTGAVTRVLPGDPNGFIDGVAWSPDGRTLAAGSGQSRTIQLWDPATGVLRTTYDQETGWGEFSALPIAFSPSGTHFGYGRGDATVVMARNPA